jgi:RNA polymerase sigma-70 factor (ECF subfamily)
VALHASLRPTVTDSRDAALAALMESAQSGDQRAYQALLRACLPEATAMARRQGVPPDRVDDVVQDVLLTIHRARATYDPARPFLPWLRAIAQRRAIDALRIHYRGAGREVFNEDAYLAHPDSGPAADAGLGRGDQARALAEAIATLPPGQRQAVELLALGERSLDEAAQDTGRSKGALKVNLHRAIQALRTIMADRRDV